MPGDTSIQQDNMGKIIDYVFAQGQLTGMDSMSDRRELPSNVRSKAIRRLKKLSEARDEELQRKARLDEVRESPHLPTCDLSTAAARKDESSVCTCWVGKRIEELSS